MELAEILEIVGIICCAICVVIWFAFIYEVGSNWRR